MSNRQEGYTFNPDKKEPAVDKASFLNMSLDDIIKQNRAARKSSDSKSSKISKKQTSEKKNRTTRKTSRKSSRQEKKESKKETPSKKQNQKNAEIKVPETVLREILNSVGVDTEGYNLRLVASKKK